ncbi:hypothetical protein [Brachymonas sp. M4Q-1]|uniref:hypothetical protein n=1 Tax=Brachymonas sp. M4Q-1 TaxID=3416906 RepID=UPI003CF97C33
MPSSKSPPSFAAIVSVGAFALLSMLGGWIIVWGGGFYHSPNKYVANARFYDGGPAVLMALLQFLAAALGWTWLFCLRLGAWAAATLGFVLVFVPPALFWVLAR